MSEEFEICEMDEEFEQPIQSTQQQVPQQSSPLTMPDLSNIDTKKMMKKLKNMPKKDIESFLANMTNGMSDEYKKAFGHIFENTKENPKDESVVLSKEQQREQLHKKIRDMKNQRSSKANLKYKMNKMQQNESNNST